MHFMKNGFVAALIAAAVTVSPAARADDPALRDAASMTGLALFLNSGAPGLILAVVRGDESFVEGYGRLSPSNEASPDGRTIVRLGSVSKVFAGDVLAAMATRGRVGLSDPLARYAPQGVAVKPFGDRAITLLDLVTHSAGLPREAVDPATSPAGQNPFSIFTPAAYWKWVEKAPAYRPGTTAIYSNLGFGLLGEALAKAGGKPFAELLHEHVVGPLGLTDTGTRLSPAQKTRLMAGLDPLNQPDPNWEVPPVMDASAGVYSTANDMMKWMRWHLSDTDEGRAARLLAHATWLNYDGLARLVGVEGTGAQGLGFGWVVSQAKDGVPLMLGKSGGLGGFMSYVALSPNRRIGIFVAVSRVNFGMFDGIQRGVRELAAELAPSGP